MTSPISFMDPILEFLGSFDLPDSQGTVVATAEEEDEAQEEEEEEEELFSVVCRTRPTPVADSSGDEDKEGDERVINAPTPPTKKAAKKGTTKPARETRELPPVPDFNNILSPLQGSTPSTVKPSPCSSTRPRTGINKHIQPILQSQSIFVFGHLHQRLCTIETKPASTNHDDVRRLHPLSFAYSSASSFTWECSDRATSTNTGQPIPSILSTLLPIL
jgi:hypothetical protein